MPEPDLIPVTILTGFLGAGKTTLLNRLLSVPDRRFAVIENEFGEVGIDQELVDAAQGNLFEMNNGCLCCTVRTDLIRILNELQKRRDEFDYVLIESTGLADPGAVVQTFVLDQQIARHYYLDGIVSVADALHLPRQLQNAREAGEQLRFADVILLNKTDLVEKTALEALTQQIRLRNLHALIYPTSFAELAVEKVLGIRAFNMDNILASDPDFLDVSYPFEWVGQYALNRGDVRLSFDNPHREGFQMLILFTFNDGETAFRSTVDRARAIFRNGFLRMEQAGNDGSPLMHFDIPDGLSNVKATISLPEPGYYLFFLEKHPHHFEIRLGEEKQPPLRTERFGHAHTHESVQSVALSFEGALNGAKVDDWLTHLLDTRGDDLYRTKGILNLSHSERKVIVQAVHRQFNSRYGADWGRQPRQNNIVFIGRNLDRQQLETGLLGCREGEKD